MADLIARVTSTGPHAPLAGLVTSSLGLDVWEISSDYVVLQAGEAQTERLEAMGYAVEQLQLTEAYLSDFATDEAVTGYHTAAAPGGRTCGSSPRTTRRSPSCTGSGAAWRAGRSGRCGWGSAGSARKVAFLGCHHAREWISVEVPYLLAADLLANSSTDPVQRWLRTRSGSPRWSTRTGTSSPGPTPGCGGRTGGATRTAASASTPTATTATCGAR